MLAIISDLHLCDGTATEENVSPDAFGLFLQDLYGYARDYRAKSLDILYLGDIFDLIRTTAWLEAPPAERPWGSAAALGTATPEPKVLARALDIARKVKQVNARAFEVLLGDADAEKKLDCRIRRLFIPGNHDRLYNHSPELRAFVRQSLGAVDETDPKLAAEGIFPHRIAKPEYALLARHGHEWDEWNVECYPPKDDPADFTDDDYKGTPIGDPITTELVSRVAFEVRKRLEGNKAFSDEELRGVIRRLQRIEDVRPLMASFRWIGYEAGRLRNELPEPQRLAVDAALTESVRAVGAGFEELPYYQAWRERHHRLFRIDAAEKLDLLLGAFRRFETGLFAQLGVWLASHVEGADAPDPLHAGAAKEKRGLDEVATRGTRYVVYGHTHEPLEAALRAGATEDVYINSGTWRKREFATEDGGGFIGREVFSYVVFLDKSETPSDRIPPGYVRWVGTRTPSEPPSVVAAAPPPPPAPTKRRR